MTNRQLPDFLTAENDLDGQEPVYIAQGGKTRKTLLSKIKEFIIGTTELTTTDKSISGAIEEVKEIADNNTTQLKESAQNITNLQNNKANLISTPQCTTKDITLYVSQNGNDSNDGLTEGTAVRTIQRAIDYIPKNVKHITKINVAKGNYDEIVVLVGFYGDGEIYITGDIDLSDGHIVKRIISRRNKVFIKFFGIKIQCNDETSVYSANELGLYARKRKKC